jgi:hypothetical protein
MATLYVTEYSGVLQGDVQIAMSPAIVQNNVAIGGSSAQSNPFNGNTSVIRVHTDAICSIAISNNPTATAASKRMAADQTEYWGVRPGDKIAVITNT